jgi:DNA repair protein RecN (Recombination protein N)
MQQLSSLLVDLHRQFDTFAITDNDFQVNVLDALAGNSELLRKYKDQYKNWQQAVKVLCQLREQQSQFQKESDYNQFLYDELAEANFHENELEKAEEEMKLLSNAEEIKSALNKVSYELNEGEQPIVQQLKNLTNQLRSFSGYHKDLANLSGRLSSAQIEIQDIAGEIESINDHIHYYPEKIEKLNDRISQGYKLQKKHGVNATTELLQIQKQLEEKLQATLHIADDIEELEKQTSQICSQAVEAAEQISQGRKRQIAPFEKQVNKLLAQVGMPNAAIKVSITGKEPGVNGMDDIEFLFDANKSGQYKPVSKVASGGELSRLMLCIKSLVAKSMDMPTLIFDEIDTGISGEAARQVGIIMKELAQNRQIICITHQPQIAGKASAHFFVYKEPENNVITTNIRLLDNDERITTIAKMLSGEKPTAAALQNAREMVQN